MCVSATVRFAVVVVRVTSERCKGTNVFTEVVTDFLLDVNGEALEETLDTLGLNVHKSASGCLDEDDIVEGEG